MNKNNIKKENNKQTIVNTIADGSDLATAYRKKSAESEIPAIPTKNQDKRSRG